MNESDAFSLLQSLGNYLKTDIESTYGIIEKQARRGYRREIVQGEGYTYKVTVSHCSALH